MLISVGVSIAGHAIPRIFNESGITRLQQHTNSKDANEMKSNRYSLGEIGSIRAFEIARVTPKSL